jgi:hypothetical protein
MTDVKYQVSIIKNGQPTLSITAVDPKQAAEALGWLSMSSPIAQAPRRADARVESNPVGIPFASKPEAPICAIHQKPMTLMTGKRGQFYSCHEKMQDGSWCRYKPMI